MITVITGTPGAGKTLYTIEKLLLPYIGKTVKGRDDAGNEVEHPRTIYTNINGLQIEHELIDKGGAWEQDKGSKEWKFQGLPGGLADWHKWAKPGALIVFDEVQKVWSRMPNGSPITPDIQELDTHRHKGVDFILITQTVNNISAHIHGLGGRHLHVRRVGNMKAAIVYEWDHVSKSLQYSKAIAKAPWRYSKKVFKLYKSAELHTKVKRSIPPLIWFILAGIGIAAYGVPTYMDRMKDRTFGAAELAEQSNVETKESDVAKPAAQNPAKADAQTVVAAVEPEKEKPVLSGCIASAARCVCYTADGVQVEPEPGYCYETTKPKIALSGGNVDWYKPWQPPQKEPEPIWTGVVVGTQKGWHF